jgi:hypothetical protein
MADRYWVGVTNQDWNNTGNWSATSGGGSGASFPTAADDVFFDANSNLAVNKNVNINVASACRRIDFKVYTGAVTMSNSLTVGATVAVLWLAGPTIEEVGLLVRSTVPIMQDGQNLITG